MTTEKIDYSITIKSKNDSLYLSPYSTCRIIDGGIEGFDFPETRLAISERGFGDGGVVSGAVICPRTMNIEFDVVRREKFEAVKAVIQRLMSPHSSVTIATSFEGRRREIDAVPASKPQIVRGNFHDRARVKLSFTACEPLFRSEKKTEVNFPTVTPILSFPLNLMKGAGSICSFAGSPYSGSIDNPGDTECGFTAVLTAQGGEVAYPSLHLGRRYISLEDTLAAGDVMEICTSSGHKSISVNGEERYSFSRSSEFFSLSPGINSITLTANSGLSHLAVHFEFYPLYFGW